MSQRSNAYRSSNSVIISGPGTMYNEVTRPKSTTKQYNENTNTHDVTVRPVTGLRTKSVQYIRAAPYRVKTSKSKSKSRKNKKK